ncbi:unnamed protein product, partial [Rotaria sp. Silwood1]
MVPDDLMEALLIANPELSSTIKSAIVGHSSRLLKEETTQIKRLILFLCTETDHAFLSELKEYFKIKLTENGLGTFLKYSSTVRGFIVRPDGFSQVNQQNEKAIQDTTEYLKKYLICYNNENIFV